MAVDCEKCGKSMDKVVASSFLRFETGRIICPECHKLNKRYVSEFDLLVYLIGISIFVGTLLVVQTSLDSIFRNLLLAIVVIGFVSYLLYTVLTQWACYVYVEAPYKKEWRDHPFEEDIERIKKVYLYHIIGFLGVAVVLQPIARNFNLFFGYLALLLVYIAYLILKAKKVYDREKKIVEESKN